MLDEIVRHAEGGYAHETSESFPTTGGPESSRHIGHDPRRLARADRLVSPPRATPFDAHVGIVIEDHALALHLHLACQFDPRPPLIDVEVAPIDHDRYLSPGKGRPGDVDAPSTGAERVLIDAHESHRPPPPPPPGRRLLFQPGREVALAGAGNADQQKHERAGG